MLTTDWCVSTTETSQFLLESQSGFIRLKGAAADELAPKARGYSQNRIHHHSLVSCLRLDIVDSSSLGILVCRTAFSSCLVMHNISLMKGDTKVFPSARTSDSSSTRCPMFNQSSGLQEFVLALILRTPLTCMLHSKVTCCVRQSPLSKAHYLLTLLVAFKQKVSEGFVGFGQLPSHDLK